MNGLILGLLGVYVISVGFAGNAGKFGEMASEDFPGFVPWIGSIAALYALYQSEMGREFVKPFATLIVLTFVFKNWDTIARQTNEIYSMVTK